MTKRGLFVAGWDITGLVGRIVLTLFVLGCAGLVSEGGLEETQSWATRVVSGSPVGGLYRRTLLLWELDRSPWTFVFGDAENVRSMLMGPLVAVLGLTLRTKLEATSRMRYGRQWTNRPGSAG